jgi:hypothetical protein
MVCGEPEQAASMQSAVTRQSRFAGPSPERARETKRGGNADDKISGMKRRRFEMRKLSFLTFVAMAFFGATFMSAQNRTWVSGLGDDANPCSRTAPCKTFAGAIFKTAAGGEIDALDAGAYGTFAINKAITIDGGGGQVASSLDGDLKNPNGITVQAGPKDVVIIRNLRVNGVGIATNGIRFVSGQTLHIEHCSVFGWTNAGIDIEPTNGGKVFIDDTTSTDNGFAGLFVQSASVTQVDIYRSRFQFNGIHGVWASSNSQVSATHSDASGNAGDGFIAAPNAGTAELNLTSSSANNNGTGVLAGGTGFPGTVRVTGVVLNNNGTGFLTQSNGTIASFGNNYNSGSGKPTAGAGIGVQ